MKGRVLFLGAILSVVNIANAETGMTGEVEARFEKNEAYVKAIRDKSMEVVKLANSNLEFNKLNDRNINAVNKETEENTSLITAINKELDDHKVAAAQRDKLIDQGRGAQLVASQHIIGIKANEHAVSSNVIDQTNKLLGNEEVEGVTLKDYIQINDPYSGNPAMAKHHKAEMQAVDKTYEVIGKNKENSETALATAKGNTTNIAANNEKIASNIADTGKNTSSITAINKELDDHKIESDKAIAQLKEQDKLLKATDAKLAKTDENLKEADSKIQKNIDQLEKHHDAVYETIGTTRDVNAKDIKVVKADINRDRIIALEGQTKSVETNEANITKNTAKTLANEKNIVKNTEKIEYNSKGISNNSERIGSLEGKVDGLETEMKKGFAMSAAMSSIDFQVLDVGDAGFGFGVGNYKNSEAVSLGVGVRPTENMTLNVKGAMSTGKGQETMVGGGAVYKFNLFGG